MSLTINRIGGSGGVSESNAILMAHVPTGSTVTASKGGVILTPKMWASGLTADEDVAMFIFSPAQFDSVNPWTIMATNGTDTASTTVLITTNKEYEIDLHYTQLLYNAGNEYTAITGGWDGGATDPRYTRQGTVIKYSDNINIQNIANGSYGIITHNQVDLTTFSIVEVEWWRGSNAADVAGVKVAESFPTQTTAAKIENPVATIIPSTDPSNPTITQLDISELSGNYRVAIQGALNSGIFIRRIELKP